MPNTLAYIAILAWPLVVVALFRALPIPKAAAISIIAGYLLLPTKTSFDLPLLPAYDRDLAASLPALLMAMVLSNRRQHTMRLAQVASLHSLDGWLPRPRPLFLCVLVLICSPFLTTLTNGSPISNPGIWLPPMRLYDAGSLVLTAAFTLLPFFLARKFLAHPREHAMLLGVLCVAGLIYSLPTLWEVRMSPQLNNQIYGFFPHDWRQHIRAGGFRPIVFLEHGLRLGIFLTICLLAALGLMRTRPPAERMILFGAALWFLITLVLSKNLGATLIVFCFAPLILLCGARLQFLVAGLFAALVLLYPMMRSAGLVPTEGIVAAVSQVGSPDRVASLQFRFDNEDLILARANERPLFGWGGWGRSSTYDESGRRIDVADGTWLIVFGTSGWIGYLAQFGLLTLPLILLALRRRSDGLTVATSALALLLAANLLDLLPNSSLGPITWLMAGAVAGRLELRSVERETAEPVASPERVSPYRRSFEGSAETPQPPSLRRTAERRSRAPKLRREVRVERP